MSGILKSSTFLSLLFLVFSLSSAGPAFKETVIYIVRHAEKEVSDPGNKDPDLNAAGKKRAEELSEFLRKQKITAVFATKFKRTVQTAAPVARRNGIPVKTYVADDYKGIAQLILTEYPNQKTLITGHSNTVLELIKAFSLIPPVDELKDDDYDLIFTVSIDKNGDRTLKTQRFGKAHHSTKIPEIHPAP